MRILFIIVLSLLFLSSKSQKKINFGVQPHFSLNRGVDNYPLLGGTVFSVYNKYELSFGYCQTELGVSQYNVNGFVLGFKYHVLNPNKISHFTLGLDYQTLKYLESIGTPALNYHFDYLNNNSFISLVSGKTNSTSYLLGVGYELKINSHIAFSPLIGSGLVNIHTVPTALGIQLGHTNKNRWYFSHYFQISFRFYFFGLGILEKGESAY